MMRLLRGIIGALAFGALIFACSSASEPTAAPAPGNDAALAPIPDAAPPTPEASCSVDVGVDARNCGRCGHDCLGGTCAAGRCQPVRLAIDRSNLLWMAVDATHVYFYENGLQRIARVAKTGVTVEIVSGTPGGYPPAALDETNIYLNVAGGVRVVPKSNLGQGSMILAGYAAIAADADNVYAVPSPQTSGGIIIGRSAKPGGAVQPIGNATIGDVTTQDKDFLYVASYDGIRKLDKRGSAPDAAPSPLFTPAVEPGDVAVDAKYVYYASAATGAIKRVPKQGGTADVLASGVDAPNTVAVDGSGIYFTSEEAGLILSCPLTGCLGDPVVLAERQAQPHALAVDDVAVYWITRRGGTVMRVAK